MHNFSPPIIKLELEHMKQTLCVMLGEYTAKLDEQLKAAVDAYVTSGRVETIINDTVRQVYDREIAHAIEHYYRYGPGMAYIKERVSKRLDELHRQEQEHGAAP